MENPALAKSEMVGSIKLPDGKPTVRIFSSMRAEHCIAQVSGVHTQKSSGRKKVMHHGMEFATLPL